MESTAEMLAHALNSSLAQARLCMDELKQVRYQSPLWNLLACNVVSALKNGNELADLLEKVLLLQKEDAKDEYHR